MDYVNPVFILKWRRSEDLTQAEAADLLGVNLRSWQRYEYGERRFPHLLFEAIRTIRRCEEKMKAKEVQPAQ